ncbi:MAG: 23S rRNA (guanosine(2251)-2'-O)-methyltransferase RlmB, partial [Oscillospiraceae bacterium]|nr:23S rRNA (guanosine(2251)-2'-O)-methyltransferase RlmB [Oscillospiraceae bacterium]
EALKSGRTIDKVFIASGDTDRGLQRLAAQAKEAGAVIVPVDRRKLDAMSVTHAHQGVICLAAAHDYYTIDDILAEAQSRGEEPLIVICDELTDPHNLGAILRSAECAGAHGVIIPKRRSVGLTAVVAKASAGAVEYMKVARVTNITAAIEDLKKRGVWIYGTAAEGSIPMYKADLKGAAAIVIGNEGDGMSQLVRKSCDVMVHIPMKGRISSLNASAAASILLYEAVRQRIG